MFQLAVELQINLANCPTIPIESLLDFDYSFSVSIGYSARTHELPGLLTRAAISGLIIWARS